MRNSPSRLCHLVVVPTGIEPVCHAWEACILTIRWRHLKVRKVGDSNPRYGCPYVSLANWWFQPLTQPSLGAFVCQTQCKSRYFFSNDQEFGWKSLEKMRFSWDLEGEKSLHQGRRGCFCSKSRIENRRKILAGRVHIPYYCIYSRHSWAKIRIFA